MPQLPLLRTETCSASFMAELLALLGRSGFSPQVQADGRTTLLGSGPVAGNGMAEHPPAEDTGCEAPPPPQQATSDPITHPATPTSTSAPETRADRSEMYHGITADDMPGKDILSRRLNFALFRRGKLKAYKECQKLTGEALKAEFARINASQKSKSHRAGEQRTEKIRLK